jgi:DNA-binding MarR family transcriptional regulator
MTDTPITMRTPGFRRLLTVFVATPGIEMNAKKLAKRTGLSAPTCGAYMNRLIKEGWAEKRTGRLDGDKPVLVTFFRLTDYGEQEAAALLKADG